MSDEANYLTMQPMEEIDETADMNRADGEGCSNTNTAPCLSLH